MSAAIFISYASQDTEAARRIGDTLQAAGIEVWFDRTALRGGDAWETDIRRQIKECALFIPVISTQTQARAEGFFRLEWHLAEQRTFLIAQDTPFLLPVMVDDIPDAEARVPERFREKQWTRLIGGQCPPAFAARVKALLDELARQPGSRQPPKVGSRPPGPGRNARPAVMLAIGALVCLGAGALWFLRPQAPAPGPAPAAAAAPLSAARQLAQKADEIVRRPGEKSSDMLQAAEDLYSRALELDSADAATWAAAARLDAQTVFLRFDVSEARRNRAKQRMARAAALAPDAPFVRRAQASVYAFADGSPPMLAAAEKIYRELLAQTKDDKTLIADFGLVLRHVRKFEEAAQMLEEAGLIEDAGWTYCRAGRYDEANRIADHLLATNRTIGAVYLKIDVQSFGFEDMQATTAAEQLFTPEELLLEGPAANVAICALWVNNPERALTVLNAFPQDFIFTLIYGGPKRYLTGLAHERAGRPEAARAEWLIALDQVRQRLQTKPNDPEMLGMEALVLACLGEKAAAERALALYRSIARLGPTSPPDEKEALTLLRLGRTEQVLLKAMAVLGSRPPGYEILHCFIRLNPDYALVRDDPRMQKMLRDTLPPFAKPFELATGPL